MSYCLLTNERHVLLSGLHLFLISFIFFFCSWGFCCSCWVHNSHDHKVKHKNRSHVMDACNFTDDKLCSLTYLCLGSNTVAGFCAWRISLWWIVQNFLCCWIVFCDAELCYGLKNKKNYTVDKTTIIWPEMDHLNDYWYYTNKHLASGYILIVISTGSISVKFWPIDDD